ncbi:MAG: glycosyltransferase [Verrucomicrobiota bacterium]|nr:glycosyltransferase [Verrucomicrobiota bacterium]
MSSASVCAVVVTYNRRELLRECVAALLAQTQQVEKILIVNNASTDGTVEMLAAEFPTSRHPQMEVLTLPVNIGGAGGFRAGMLAATAGTERSVAGRHFTVAQHDSRPAEFKSGAEHFDPNSARLESDIAQSKSGDASSQSDVAQLNPNAALSEADVAQSTSDVAQSKSDAARSNSDVVQSESDEARWESDVAQFQSDVAPLESDVAQLKSNAAPFHSNVAAPDRKPQDPDRVHEPGPTLAFAPGWLWLMDDDTIPSSDALEKLLTAWGAFPESRKPELFASKSVWADGSIHPMNVPQTRPGDAAGAYLAAEHATISLRTATFVSVLIRASCVQTFGVPMADYFIWGEDVEYTGRILRETYGVLVPASVVVHKTATSYGPVEGSAARFYYFVRNGIWMMLWSPAWTRNERIKLAVGFVRVIGAFLGHTSERAAGVKSIARGLRDSFTKRPRQ